MALRYEKLDEHKSRLRILYDACTTRVLQRIERFVIIKRREITVRSYETLFHKVYR